MDSKTYRMCKIEKHVNSFYKNVQNVKIVIVEDA